MKGAFSMMERLIEVEDVKAVFKEMGVESEEYNQCKVWTSPKLEEPLTNEDMILAELSSEEQGFLRCMGYVFEEKVVDSFRAGALYETFWNTVRILHESPRSGLAVKEGKYIVGS
jgi:hypothetical protein